MRYLLFTIAFLFSLYILAQKKSDSLAIVQLLREDYSTLMTYDVNKHMKHCTDDYLLIENGEIWNIGKEAEWYKKNAIKNANIIFDRKDYFNFKLLKISGNTAYTVFELISEITKNGSLTTKRYSESVVFRKVQGKWKIALIHSTPVINPVATN